MAGRGRTAVARSSGSLSDRPRRIVLDDDEDDQLRALSLNALTYFGNPAVRAEDDELARRVEGLNSQSRSRSMKKAAADYLAKRGGIAAPDGRQRKSTDAGRLDHETSEEEFAALVDRAGRELDGNCSCSYCPNGSPVYQGRSANTVTRMRGYLLAAFEEAGLLRRSAALRS